MNAKKRSNCFSSFLKVPISFRGGRIGNARKIAVLTEDKRIGKDKIKNSLE
ncbi:hypothetical protein ACSAZL_01990 [Methanosarcina sp. T3]|uniref:hypothetical protein n=1 Tax=Methanosarcina sp. T3 TaxID=3439062 RepID=UPI003F8447CB